MNLFLLLAGLAILGTVLLGLARIFFGPSDAERLMATQLLGTGGVAALLLLGSGADLAGATDLALAMTLLAAFALIAFIAGWDLRPSRHQSGVRSRATSARTDTAASDPGARQPPPAD